jgi:hypothetical protein
MGLLYGLAKKTFDVAKVSSRGVYSNVAQQIVYQFQALGLIGRDAEGLWKLTPYGEVKLSAQLAIKRSTAEAKLARQGATPKKSRKEK